MRNLSSNSNPVRDLIHRMDDLHPLLKTSIGLLLNSRQPAWVVWGKERKLFYNDACVPLLPSGRHPLALGERSEDGWGETWWLFSEAVEKAFTKAEVSVQHGLMLSHQDSHQGVKSPYRFSTGAIHDETGEVRGVFCSCHPERVLRGDLVGRKILLVDDAPEMRTLIAQYLEGTGAYIRTAADGVEGVEMARSEKFDLALMDIQMPRRDGVEATQILRQEGQELPIVALTAQSDQERVLRAGCDRFLAKPVDRFRLMETILHLAGSARQNEGA